MPESSVCDPGPRSLRSCRTSESPLEQLQASIRNTTYSDLLVQADNGLWRFPVDNPNFEIVVKLWALAAEGRFDVKLLDWEFLQPPVRRLMTSVAAQWPWRRQPFSSDDEVITIEEDHRGIVDLVEGLSTGAIAPDRVNWDAMSTRTRNEVWTLSRYEIGRLRRLNKVRRRGPPQKKAMRLLKSLLSPNQLWWLKQRRHFLTTGSTTGHVYRLHPYSGSVDRVTKHRTRWFVHTSYCLHDPERVLPPADVSVGHLLLLRSNEPSFLELANATDARRMFWNGDWLRRVHRTRKRLQDSSEQTEVASS